MVPVALHRLLLLPLLLLLLLKADATSAPGSTTKHRQDPALVLKEVEDWPFNDDGNAERTNIFCSGTLASGGQTTQAAADAIQAICNNLGPKFFSDSGADAFMASRFGGRYSYGTGLWRTAASKRPFTTEPNTPWMLADYVITLAISQKSKADGWKTIKGEAQVDFLLCRDADCSQLVDLQTISATTKDGTTSEPFLGIAYSGIAGQPELGVPAGTATHIDPNPALSPQQDKWVPPELNSSTQVHQVQYSVGKGDGFVLDRNTFFGDSIFSNIKSIASILQRNTVIEYASSRDETGAPWAKWQSAKFGHYTQSSLRLWAFVDNAACVTVVWPDHPWLQDHGWNVSDPACASKQASSPPSSTSNIVLMLDSYFPQLHILRDQVVLKHNVYNTMNGVRLAPAGAANETNGNILVAQVVAPLDAQNWGRPGAELGMVQRHPDDYSESFLIPLAGRYARTLDHDAVSAALGVIRLQTQEDGKCINTVNRTEIYRLADAAMADAALLEETPCLAGLIGTAPVAAVPVSFPEHVLGGSFPAAATKSFNSMLEKMHLLTKLHNDPSQPLPWCDMGSPDKINMINVWVEGASPAALPEGPDLDAWYLNNTLTNCTFWDERGIGYASGKQPPWSKGEAPFAMPLINTTQYWINATVSARTRLLESWGDFDYAQLEIAMQMLVRRTARLLQEQAKQELAITDATKTWAGAVLDITVTLVATVAMATGHVGMYEWVSLALTKASRQVAGYLPSLQLLQDAKAKRMQVQNVVAKLLTVTLVLMGLVVAPASILAGDVINRELNADGRSSQVGFLTVEFGGGDAKDSEYIYTGPHVLVAAVTIKLKS